MQLLTSKTKIIAAIADIHSTGKKLDNMIQVAACSIIQHVDKHGDVTLINTLIDAMPKGSRVNALRDFIGTFAKATYDGESKAFKFDKDKTTDLQGAMAIMWTEFKPEPAYEAFDLNALLAGLLKKADKAIKDDKHRDEVDMDLLHKLQALQPKVDEEPAH